MDVAVALGGAECVWDDYERASEMLESVPDVTPVTVAVNDAGAYFEGQIDHWVSLHPEKFVGAHHPGHNPERVCWERIRSDDGHPDGYVTWSRRDSQWVDRVIEHWGAGSSGLFAVTVAYHLGIEKVVLCGVPIDERPHFDGATGVEDEDGKWADHVIHKRKWRDEEILSRLRGRVKSMSGWTRDLLGGPTMEWLGEEIRASA